MKTLLSLALWAGALAFGQVQPATPMAAPAASPAAWVGSAGGGYIPHGGTFTYYSISKYLGQSSYMTVVNEYRLQSGAVSSCTMAGISKVLYSFGFASFGTVGTVGDCSSVSGSAISGEVQPFVHVPLGKSGWGVLVTARKTMSPVIENRNSLAVTAGVSYGR